MTVIRSIFVFFLHFELVKVITGPCHGLVCKAQAVTFANQLRDGLYNLLNSSTKMEELKVSKYSTIMRQKQVLICFYLAFLITSGHATCFSPSSSRIRFLQQILLSLKTLTGANC